MKDFYMLLFITLVLFPALAAVAGYFEDTLIPPNTFPLATIACPAVYLLGIALSVFITWLITRNKP